jgi:hypothetical protein
MTVPFGGDVANPAYPAESGPGVVGYVLGGILIAAGIIGGIAWLVVGLVGLQDTVDDFERAPVDQVKTVDLDAGDYVAYGEKGGGDAIQAVLASFRIRPAGGDGEEIDVHPYDGEVTYDFGDRPLRAQFTFEIEESGEYEVIAEGISSGATTVAMGPSIAGDLVSAIVGALVIGGLGVIIGVALLIITGVRRRRFRQRNWQGGWGSGQPGAWNPPAPPGGYGTTPPPPGGAWNPPPPPSNYPPGTTF